MPAVQGIVKNFFKKDPCKGVNPDEAVAAGAAIQGGIMTKKYAGGSQMILLDVTPLTLGIETYGGVFTPIIDRNTTIPVKKAKVFSTAADAQTEVECKVLQGERPIADQNKLLGKFILDGLPPVPKGVPQIEVIFDVDASGVVHVNAVDKKTGKSQSIRVQAKGGLSESEIDDLIKEAEVHREADTKRKELLDVRNGAESTLNKIDANLENWRSSISKEDLDSLSNTMTEVRALLSNDDTDPNLLKEAAQKLDTLSLSVFERAYNAKGAASSNTN